MGINKQLSQVPECLLNLCLKHTDTLFLSRKYLVSSSINVSYYRIFQI